MYNEKLKKIIKYYGVKNQLKYWATEVQELNEAIIEYEIKQTKKEHKHIIEELGDNLVMLKQIQSFYGIDDEDLVEIMEFKIDRQINRIIDNELDKRKGKNENNICD